MSPNRFPDFTPEQRVELAREYDRIDARLVVIWKRWVAVTVILALFTAGGYAVGLYVNQQQTQRAHNLAHATCVRSQDGRRALTTIVSIAIPLHAKGRTAQQQQGVNMFYQQINKSRALKVPSCKN